MNSNEIPLTPSKLPWTVPVVQLSNGPVGPAVPRNGRLWEDEASLASQAVDNMQEPGSSAKFFGFGMAII